MNVTNTFLDQRVSRPRRSHFAAATLSEPPSASVSGDDAETAPPLPASGTDLARALNDLLTRYVALLDSSWHGGWDQSDDAAVRRARSVLTHAGFAAMFPAEIAHHLDLALPGGAPAA